MGRFNDRIEQLRRETTPPEDEPPVVFFFNNPMAVRLGFDLTSERMALVAGEVFEAEAMEPTRAFHHRLVDIARSRGVFVVSIGSDEPAKVSRYDMQGKLIVLN